VAIDIPVSCVWRVSQSSVLQCVAVRCSVLQCVAVCCSVLQIDAVYIGKMCILYQVPLLLLQFVIDVTCEALLHVRAEGDVQHMQVCYSVF